MGIVLKVTPEELTRMAQDIDTEIGNMKKQFEGIESDVTHTLAYWEGDASDSHKKQYDAIKGDIEESIKRLREQPKDLLEMAGIYTKTESEVEAVAQTLSADVIV